MTEVTEATPTSTQEIVVNRDPKLDVKELKFGFRTSEDEAGVKTKRATVELKVPVLSVEGIIDVMQRGGKELELLQQAVENTYADFIKSLLADDASLTTENFPIGSVSWAAIANQPESDKRGRGIAKEVWDDFYKDYLAVMPGLTNMDQKHIERQVAILSQKLNPLKNHEKKAQLLPKMKEMLTIYANGSKNAENFVDCVEFLVKKADALLTAEANLAENLGFE